MSKVIKSAESVRVKAKPVRKIVGMERPGTGGTGSSRTGHSKTAANVGVQTFGAGIDNRKKKVRDPKKTVEKAVALRSSVSSQAKNLTMPIPPDQEKECLDEYLHMFKTLQDMVRVGEQKYLESKATREVYALMTMYSQLREVIADIRSVTDMSSHAENIIQSIVQPAISSIAQAMVDAFYHVRILVRSIAKDEEVQYGVKKIDDIMRDQGLMLQNQYTHLSDRISETLTRH
jgi:hypothetical protein